MGQIYQRWIRLPRCWIVACDSFDLSVPQGDCWLFAGILDGTLQASVCFRLASDEVGIPWPVPIIPCPDPDPPWCCCSLYVFSVPLLLLDPVIDGWGFLKRFGPGGNCCCWSLPTSAFGCNINYFGPDSCSNINFKNRLRTVVEVLIDRL